MLKIISFIFASFFLLPSASWQKENFAIDVVYDDQGFVIGGTNKTGRPLAAISGVYSYEPNDQAGRDVEVRYVRRFVGRLFEKECLPPDETFYFSEHVRENRNSDTIKRKKFMPLALVYGDGSTAGGPHGEELKVNMHRVARSSLSFLAVYRSFCDEILENEGEVEAWRRFEDLLSDEEERLIPEEAGDAKRFKTALKSALLNRGRLRLDYLVQMQAIHDNLLAFIQTSRFPPQH